MSAVEQEVGVGQCPERPKGLGHVWAGANASGDASNPCRFCGTSGREFFQRACAARMNGFVGVVLPMESGTGKAPGKES
jgi:hypothetical protein